MDEIFHELIIGLNHEQWDYNCDTGD
jgi:hypothetical protein